MSNRKGILAGIAVVGAALLGALVAIKGRATPSLSAAATVPATPGELEAHTPADSRQGRRPPPPHFRPSDRAQALETTPGQPGYDPIKLMGVMPAVEIFRQEPRAVPWAPTLEAGLRSRLERELTSLVPGTVLESVECKTTMCKVSWQPSQPSDNQKLREFLEVLYMGSGAGSGSKASEMILVYAGGTMSGTDASDANNVIAALPAIRKRRLTQLQNILQARGEHPKYKAVARDEWPKE
jgi:hypothetical protein